MKNNYVELIKSLNLYITIWYVAFVSFVFLSLLVIMNFLISNSEIITNIESLESFFLVVSFSSTIYLIIKKKKIQKLMDDYLSLKKEFKGRNRDFRSLSIKLTKADHRKLYSVRSEEELIKSLDTIIKNQ